MKENNLKIKSFAFAVIVVNTFKTLKSRQIDYALIRQFLRSGTSVGANVAEAYGAISDAEFSSKLSISYKESLETKFWISLLHETGYLSKTEFEFLTEKCDELSKILYTIIKKTRIEKKTTPSK
jgi:four helix bundle protein